MHCGVNAYVCALSVRTIQHLTTSKKRRTPGIAIERHKVRIKTRFEMYRLTLLFIYFT